MNEAPKAEYREPALTEYGSIAKLTQAGGSVPSGGGGGGGVSGSGTISVGVDVTLP